MWHKISKYLKAGLRAMISLRKQLTFQDATSGFPAKRRLRNERRNSILMTYHYPDLGSASDWLKQISHAMGLMQSLILSLNEECVRRSNSSHPLPHPPPPAPKRVKWPHLASFAANHNAGSALSCPLTDSAKLLLNVTPRPKVISHFQISTSAWQEATAAARNVQI